MIMQKIESLVVDVKYGAIIKTKTRVDGLNLPLVVDDYIETALVMEGPNTSRAIESVEKFQYESIVVPSFHYADRLGANISIKEYYSDSFSRVQAPEQYTEDSWPYQVKIAGQHLTYYDVCRIFNHMSAWDYSIRTNKPVIVLEHDVVLHTPHYHMKPRFNSINMLSDAIYHQHNDNWVCGSGVHAYAIDCRAAKKLFNKIMSEGMINPLELLFRVDEFNVTICKKATKLKEIHEFSVSNY